MTTREEIMTERDTTALKDRVVVITGGARGMGRAYTEAFLAAGAKVVATDRSWAGVEELDPKLTASGGNALKLDMDVTKVEQIDKAYDAATARFGTIDVLINNAAMRQRDLFPPTGRVTTLETKDADWEKSFAVNVFGALKVTRRFIRPMIEKRRGSIVNTVSSGILHHSHGGGYTALRPNSREMPYQSSKAALATMSFYLADEVKEHNVAVNIVVPGHTRTTGFDEQNRARLAMGSRPGPPPVVPEHMVPLVMHLATQDATTITGKMFDVMEWNIEHGRGGHERWADKSFSYEALMPR
jgi:NAD(P)-dependent dehydrogenase (short-subunit alcohol dehydrogenase family)